MTENSALSFNESAVRDIEASRLWEIRLAPSHSIAFALPDRQCRPFLSAWLHPYPSQAMQPHQSMAEGVLPAWTRLVEHWPQARRKAASCQDADASANDTAHS